MYLILQQHHAVYLPQHDFLVYINDNSNAEITHSMLTFTTVMQSRKSWHMDQNHGKSHGDHEYTIIL